jgi:arginine/lysine/ornithine decarboxylase
LNLLYIATLKHFNVFREEDMDTYRVLRDSYKMAEEKRDYETCIEICQKIIDLMDKLDWGGRQKTDSEN